MQQNKIAQDNYLEEDEIDLRELFSTIWKNKLKIIFFTFVVTSLSLLYTLSIPNSYKSTTSLVSQTQAKPSLGGLGALAGMAGISLGSSSGDIDTVTSFSTILGDFEFQKKVIEKYNLVKKIVPKKENLVFAMGIDAVYKLFHSKSSEEIKSEEAVLFETYKSILDMVSISSDKKSGIITLSVESYDRYLAKELVEIYLKELTTHLREVEMRDIQKQIDYYTKEMQLIDEVAMKEQLGQLASSLIQKKVLSMANELYNVKQFTKPQVAYIKDKSKPKRALIIIVAFITSIILGIFMVFFLEFLRSEEKE